MRKFAFAALFLLTIAASARAEFRAGAAKVDITPPTNSWMGGYMPATRSSGVHDPLYARCISMTGSAGQSYALVSLEIIGLFKDDVDRLIKAAAEKSGIPESNLFVSSIHTHKGPDVMGIWGGMPPTYFKKFFEKAADCVATAHAAERPSVVLFSEGDAGKYNHNRRHGGAFVDPILRVMQFIGVDGNVIATAVNYAAHPVILSFDSSLNSADYVGPLNATLEERVGGIAAFFLAAAGDVNPDFDPSKKAAGSDDPYAIAQAMGRSLAEIAIQATGAPTARVDTDPVLSIRDVPFDFPVENKNIRLIMQSGLARVKLRGNSIAGRFSILRIGPAEIVALPFEPATDVWLGVRDKMKSDIRWPISFGQGYFGYVVPDNDYREGDYESGLSLGPKTGGLIIANLGAAVADEK